MFRSFSFILLLLVSTDAIRNNGAYTQAAWEQISTQVVVQLVKLNERVQEASVHSQTVRR